MIKTDRCPVCNSQSFRELKNHIFKYPGDEVEKHLADITYERLWILFKKIIKNEHRATFTATLCQSCGLIFTNPRFTEREIGIKYDTINQLNSVKYRLKQDPIDDVKVGRRSMRIYELITRFLNNRQREDVPSVLDYGGASGYILIPFIDSFKCAILDYEKWDLPSNVEYLGKDLSNLSKSDRFDVILLLHTLEHIVHPTNLLNDLCEHLSDDGMIYVEVPLGCFQEWKFIGEPMTHINFFSEESLLNCFTNCSLNVIYLSTSYQRVTRGKTWCLNILGTKKKVNNPIRFSDVLSTQKQRSKVNYYLPYLFNWRAFHKIFRKMFSF